MGYFGSRKQSKFNDPWKMVALMHMGMNERQAFFFFCNIADKRIIVKKIVLFWMTAD